MTYQLTVAIGGHLTNWYFDDKAEGQEARVHADVAGCIFLYGEADDGAAPYECGSEDFDTAAQFTMWLNAIRGAQT